MGEPVKDVVLMALHDKLAAGLRDQGVPVLIATLNGLEGVLIDLPPSGEIAGDTKRFEHWLEHWRRTIARRARANRYQRSSTDVLPWRRRVAKGGY